MQQENRTNLQGVDWHKVGYRVIDCSTDDILRAQVQFIGADGKPLGTGKPGPIYQVPNKPDFELPFCRAVMLMKVLCRFRNAGGEMNDLRAISEDFYHRTTEVTVDNGFKPFCISAEGFFEILYKKSEDEYLRVVEDDFWEDLDSRKLVTNFP